MITSAILQLFYTILVFILTPILAQPNVVYGASTVANIAAASGYISSMNAYLPVDTILSIVGVLLGFEIVYGVYKIIMWVVRRLPTQS